LVAIGGGSGAGIGTPNGDNLRSGSITIAGGTVEAHSSATDDQGEAAAIGAGQGGKAGPIRITGGRVYAYAGSKYGYASAAIGGSFRMAETYTGGLVEISGGTVYACGGRQDADVFASDIGDGLTYSQSYDNNVTVVITGGNVVLAHFDSEKERFTQGRCTVTNMAHDAAGRVLHAVVVPLGTPDAAAELSGLDGYGTRDLYADANGDLYLWLPDGDYRFEATGRGYTATVDGADTVAVADAIAVEALRIESIELVPGAVELVVSAEPDGALTAETVPLLRVRASGSLPVSAGELLDPADVADFLNDDGTATLVLPPPDPSTQFYSVELP
ncbi:MAG: hypothetical protein II839_00135, partial [Kiritimatiellae bacterium]|nr:hypothetical protein [Kiritimatiellia bacterium]